tara:strand:- start:5994 stop:6161 length:168 start_codon:yes stop_codon:yes gene_type:complete
MNNYIIYKNVSFVYEVEANSEGEAKKIAQADTKLKNFSYISEQPQISYDIYREEI